MLFLLQISLKIKVFIRFWNKKTGSFWYYHEEKEGIFYEKIMEKDIVLHEDVRNFMCDGMLI